jgi:hypothetical protein
MGDGVVGLGAVNDHPGFVSIDASEGRDIAYCGPLPNIRPPLGSIP